MEFSDRDLVGSRNFVFLSALLLPGLLVVGCVSLTKPLAVQKCAANSTCSDDPNSPLRDDAKDDTVDNPSPDLPFNEETPIVKPDAGPDVSPPLPDVPPDTADTGPGNKDTKIADVLIPADAADASPPSPVLNRKVQSRHRDRRWDRIWHPMRDVTSDPMRDVMLVRILDWM
jgi:hypothetical protein